MISLPKCVGINTKLKLHHSAHLYSVFTPKNNSLNFVKNLKENISWYVARSKAQHEIPFMNFKQDFSWYCSTACVLNFFVIQIKGEYQFSYLEHGVLVS